MELRSRLLVAGCILSLAACSPAPQEGTRNKQPATPLDPCKTENPPASCETGGGGSTGGGGDGNPSGGGGGGGSLASYLFSVDDAKGINEIVESFEDAGDSKPSYEQSNQYTGMRSFIQDFLDDAMRLKALDPGRNFTVTVIGDESINAAADHHENIIINAGAIKGLPNLSMLSTLCHEIAHSTKNHTYKGIVAESKAGLDSTLSSFDQKVNEYFASTYDEGAGRYTHDKPLYDATYEEWKKIADFRSPIWKKDESEADIVGGMICAHLGMSAKEYGDAFDNGIGQISEGDDEGESITPEQLKTGDSLELAPAELEGLFFFLFQLDSHPTHKERSDQLDRVEDVIQEHFEDQSFADDWKQGYPDAGGLSLFGGAIRMPTVKKLPDGRTITLPTHQGCRHRR